MNDFRAPSSLFALALLAACGTAPPIDATKLSAASVETQTSSYRGKPKIGSFGFDLEGMDRSVPPGADFNAYAGGKWIKNTPIPPDQGHWDAFESLAVQVAERTRAVIQDQTRLKSVKGSNAQKVGDYYQTYLDRAAIDKKGFGPAKPWLDAIEAAKTTTDIVKLMGRPDLPCATPILAGVVLDPKNPDRTTVVVGQSGLGMPSKDHYLSEEKDFEKFRADYEAHVRRVLALVGDKKAAENARAIVAVETKIAAAHWTPAERRDQDKTYNPRTVAELEKEWPQFPWKTYFEAQGVGSSPAVIVRETTAMTKLAELFVSTPVATWKAYVTYHFLIAASDVLPSELEKEVFDFYNRELDGQSDPEERWQQAITNLDDYLGDAIGELYVERHFDPRARDGVVRIVENIRRAYAARIERIDWMTGETKKAALEKLAAIRLKIGYPKQWTDYSTLDIVPGDAFGNARRMEAWMQAHDVAKLNKPADREAWIFRAQTVDGGYLPNFNEIVFPAGILQPPFFDLEADDAINYGGIGGIIGHEMGHAFDDQGAKWDARGMIRNWWSATDLAAFKTRTDALADQFSQYEPLPGFKVRGRQTLGENIADLGGILAAFDAYHLSLEGKQAQLLDGFTGEQRFFLGWAQVWRRAYREEDLRNKVLTDMHSPAMVRVNGVVRNVDGWYQAFGVKEGDALYLAPDKRMRIW